MLFTRVKSYLKVGGAFLVSDMIGRNGHQRWPEALEIVQEFWRKLPPSYRFNRAVQRYEERYEDWDCSEESFEGIRSQDILPLLLEHFQFRLFIGFANVIDPFVDRAFGYNFDAKAPWDRRFIDQVHERDEKEILSGRVTPTHMLAVLGSGPCGAMMFHEPLTPEYCVRRAAVVALPTQTFEGDAYEWQTWPHSPQTELEIACRRLTSAEATAKNQMLQLNAAIKELTTRSLQLERQLEERTSWALQLNHELGETTELTQQLDQQLQERSEWALVLDQELEQRTESTLRLNQELDHRNREFEERTAWALSLNEQLGARNAQIRQLTQHLEQVAWARALNRIRCANHNRCYRISRAVPKTNDICRLYVFSRIAPKTPVWCSASIKSFLTTGDPNTEQDHHRDTLNHENPPHRIRFIRVYRPTPSVRAADLIRLRNQLRRYNRAGT